MSKKVTTSSKPLSPLNRKLSKQAGKALLALIKSQPKHARQISARIEEMRLMPYPSDSKKLQGYDDFYRVDVGEMRIIYSITHEFLNVEIIGKRNDSEVYKLLKRKITS